MSFDVNGWYPRLRKVNGRIFCAYGIGQTRVAELRRDGQNIVTLRDEFVASGMYGAQIRNNGDCIALQELPNDRARLCTFNVLRDWVYAPLNDDPDLVAGNLFAVTDDLWTSWLASRMRVAINGRAYPGGGTLAAGGPYVAHSKDGNNTVVVRRHIDGSSIEHACRIVNYHQSAVASNGAVIYGGYGPVHGFKELDRDEDLTVTPWRVEGIGLAWVGSDGQTWIATMGENRVGTVQVYIRPWGGKECVIVNQQAIDLSIIEDGDSWIVASCGARGELSINVVPISSPRRLVPDIQPDVTTPIPSVPQVPTVPSEPEAPTEQPERPRDRTSLKAEERLRAGEWITSPSGRYRWQVETDRFIGVDTERAEVFFATPMGEVRELLQQSDWNLVLYAKDGSVIWASGAQGSVPDAVTVAQDDRNLVTYADGSPRWASDTTPDREPPASGRDAWQRILDSRK